MPSDVPRDLIDLRVPAAPGSLMRSVVVSKPGKYRLARRDCELYSVQIVSAGAWGRAKVMNGKGRPLWEQPSTFTGSFWLSAGAEDGIIVHLYSTESPNLTINWREPDLEMV